MISELPQQCTEVEDVLVSAKDEPSAQPPDNISCPLIVRCLFFHVPLLLTAFSTQATVSNLSASMEPPDQALRRLVSGDIPQGELAASIEAVLSSRNVVDEIGHLQGRDAQAFIDAADEVCRHFPEPEKLCLTPRLIGAGESRFSATYPKQMFGVAVWGMCRPQLTSKVTTDRARRHSNRRSSVLWWVRGCMEMRISGETGCCKGVEDVCKQGLAKSHSCEPPAALQ